MSGRTAAPEDEGDTALHMAAAANQTRIAEELISRGADVRTALSLTPRGPLSWRRGRFGRERIQRGRSGQRTRRRRSEIRADRSSLSPITKPSWIVRVIVVRKATERRRPLLI
jgi:ankyrin repeat protein